MTDRSSLNKQLGLGFKNHIKQANSTRYDSAGLFQFNKGNNKSQEKGYGALASKSVLSPSLPKKEQ
jgi:hypothetical protein